MKRSELNKIMREAVDFINEMNFKLPPFAFWSPEEWTAKGHEYDEIRDNMLGWDITDFGFGDYTKIGLLMFTVRNGNFTDKKYVKPYAEKLLIVEEGQVTEIIVMLLGINDLLTTAPDLWWRRPGANPNIVMQKIEESFRDMLNKCKDKKVYICSLLPQNIAPPYDKDGFKRLILKTNKILKDICKEYGAEYVDYYSVLQKDDLLPDELSHDGIHPNGKCYKIMADILKEKIDIL